MLVSCGHPSESCLEAWNLRLSSWLCRQFACLRTVLQSLDAVSNSILPVSNYTSLCFFSTLIETTRALYCRPGVPKLFHSGPPFQHWGTSHSSPSECKHAPHLFLWAQVQFMAQTVHSLFVGGENFAGLKLISCNSTHFVMVQRKCCSFKSNCNSIHFSHV